MPDKTQSPMKASADRALKFDDAFEALQRKRGLGKVGIDIDSIKSLISADPDAAHDFVILQCALTAREPVRIQRAFMVAVLYGRITGDDSLQKSVKQLASASNLTHLLDRVTVRPDDRIR